MRADSLPAMTATATASLNRPPTQALDVAHSGPDMANAARLMLARMMDTYTALTGAKWSEPR